MKIGVTGTRNGASDAQLEQLEMAMVNLSDTQGSINLTLLHGDCVGVDAQAAKIAKRLNWRIEAFPPTIKTYRAYTTSWDILHREAGYRQRDLAIVEACDLLLAVPLGPESQYHKSGTWLTVRMARNARKPIVLVKGDRF